MTLDNRTARAFSKLAPHISGYSTKTPWEVSPDVWLPKPVVTTVHNWMHDGVHNEVDPVKYERMKKLFS